MARRVRILQDPDTLMDLYAHDLNYDHNEFLFLRYFRARTGIQVFAGLGDIDPKSEPMEQHLIIIQCRLQDCWEIFNQEGIRQEYAMECMIADARGGDAR